MKKALIIGGGAAGCSAVHQLYEIGGWDITLVEAGPFLGGGVRTQYYGGHPFTFGPRHFLTQNEKVYAYLNDIVPLRNCGDNQFITYVEPDNNFDKLLKDIFKFSVIKLAVPSAVFKAIFPVKPSVTITSVFPSII